ncbi:MAG: hypothetical protein F4X98_17720 [Gammaproteobacteria bacterium]|nr:hypothetical protein [Gammaproteobacteria bacterium]
MINRRQVVVGSALVPWAAWARPAATAGGDGDLVRLLIDTPRDGLVEALALRIGGGLQPPQLLGALAIATCREVSPFPNVGFKYHAVMMLRSVEQSVAAMSPERAWLPLLWTADYFKAAQAQEDRRRPWSLPAQEARLAPELAELQDSLASWESERADSAAAALVAAGQTPRVLQTLMLHASRDFRAIGHKTIAAANAHRLYTALGEGVASPLARSLALAVQNAEGDDPARHAYPADRDWQTNQALATSLPGDWQAGHDDFAAAQELVQELRTASSEGAATAAARMLDDNVSAHTMWEAVMVFAAELILRRNSVVSLHATTTANAMHYCYLMAARDHARRLQLLQAVAFMARFRSLVERDRRTRDRLIDDIDPLPAADLDEIFGTVGRSRYESVRQALGWLEARGDAAALGARARWYATLKNTGTHDIKFIEATLENHGWLRLAWRDTLLAAGLMYANGSSAKDDGVVVRARALLARTRSESTGL